MKELHKVYRPKDFDEVMGQEAAVKLLEQKLKSKNFPHALLLHGPTGCGKTTIARILKSKLNVADLDFVEMNASKERGIEVIRQISTSALMSSLHKGNKIYLLDEGHQLTKTAQEALLKILEDTPKHVYFILATTDPQSLIKAIHSRCTSVKLEALSPKQIRQLVKEIAECEEVELDDAVATKISQCADGLPREAVKLLDSVLNLSKDEAIASLDSIKTSEATIKDFCQAILKNGTWKDIQIMLPSLCSDPEGSRLGILGYLSAIAMKNCDAVLVELMDIFSENYYNTGRSGLIIGCWNAYRFMQSLKKK